MSNREDTRRKKIAAAFLAEKANPRPKVAAFPPKDMGLVAGSSELPQDDLDQDGGSSGSKRNIPKDHPYDPRSLKPMAKTLWATSVSLGHALTAYRHMARLKSATVSPDGMLGGRGYVMNVADMRKRLYDACESLSAITDTLHDEISAPHWQPRLAELDENEAEDIERFVEESQDILDNPEEDAEAEAQELEQENDDEAKDEADESEFEDEAPEDDAAEDAEVPEEGEDVEDLEVADPLAEPGEEGALEPVSEGEEPQFDDEDLADEEPSEEDESSKLPAGEDTEEEEPFEEDLEEEIAELEGDEPEEESEEEGEEPAKDEAFEDEEDEDTGPEAEEDGSEADEEDEEKAKKPVPPKAKKPLKPKKPAKGEDDEEEEAAASALPNANPFKKKLKKTKKASETFDTSVPSGGPRVEERALEENYTINPADAFPDDAGNEQYRDYDYSSPWENDLHVEAEAMVPDSSSDATPTDGMDYGLGWGADGGGLEHSNPSGEGDGSKGVYGPHAGLPGAPAGSSGDTSQKLDHINERMAEGKLPNDNEDPVARSDYYRGDKGNVVNAEAGIPSEPTVPGQASPGLLNTNYVYEDVETPYVRYDYTTHTYRDDPLHDWVDNK